MIIKLRHIYQVKIELKDVRPPIWRRFLVDDTSTLEEFHYTIQIIMGLTNSHLHQFISGGETYGIIDPDFDMDDDYIKDEINFRVRDILKHEGDRVVYVYDFGDYWEHVITLEKILPYNKDQPLPNCIKGKRGCPPEDVGGAWGYSEFLKKWIDETNPECEELKLWAGEYFSPETFNITEVNGMLESYIEQGIATNNFR